MAHCHPQAAYTRMQKSLQHEWVLVQYVTPRAVVKFQLVEDALRKDFLMHLFLGMEAHITVWEVTRLTMKKDGLVLHDLTLYAPENWMEF